MKYRTFWFIVIWSILAFVYIIWRSSIIAAFAVLLLILKIYLDNKYKQKE